MSDKSGPNEAQRALWNGAGGRAWVETQALMDAMLEPFEAILVDAALESGARRILDVGCGCGATTLALARRLGESGDVVGIDVSAPMVDRARERATQELLCATFVCGDAQVHPFEPPRFDRVVSRFGVMFFDDPVAAFRTLAQATRPGGDLHAVAWRSAAENPLMTAAERAVAPWLPALPPPPLDGPGQFSFAEPDRTADKLRSAGWHAIEVRSIDLPCLLPETQLLTYLTWMGPVGRALQGVDDPALREKVLAAAIEALAPWVKGGALRFEAACWDISARTG